MIIATAFNKRQIYNLQRIEMALASTLNSIKSALNIKEGGLPFATQVGLWGTAKIM